MSETLVILGGWGRSQRSYIRLINSTPPGWKVYFVAHQELMHVSSTHKLNENILRFLQKHNLTKVNLFGHSVGGALALEFTYHNPEKIKRLFLIDSEGIFGNETIFEATINFLKSHVPYARKKTAENIRALYRIFRRPMMHASLAKHAHLADLQEEAKKIKVPTIILWGEKDYLTPVWQGEKLHELIPNSKLIVLKNLDHDWILHNPDRFWRSVGS